MQLYQHHIIFDEIIYDREALKDWFESIRHYRCDFGIFINHAFGVTDVNHILSHKKPLPYGLFDTIDTFNNTGKHLIDFDIIRDLTNRFNFDQPLSAADVDILIYKPNFIFHPHIDYHMNCGIMFPILPDTGAAPIDFYALPLGEVWERAKDFRHKIKFERDFLYSYYYSQEHPSLFNGKTIHGVRNSNKERVFLRFKCLNMTFEEIAQKTQQGKFIKPLD